VEYLVFHEMLHIRYNTERRGHRRVVHSAEFREAEKKFPKYEQARRRLKMICA
jgi:predicted metal-dependent hydrolase